MTETIDVIILHTHGVETKSTKIECNFESLIKSISYAKKKGHFLSLCGISFNPDHIISVKITNT